MQPRPGVGRRRPGRTKVRRAGEAGVSNVLGAVLIFGLLVMTLVSVQVKFVPVWDREREASHMQLLSNQLGQIKSDLDHLADNSTAVPISDPLSLRPKAGMRFFAQDRLPATLTFTPAASGSGLSVATTGTAHLLQQNGQTVFAGSESWTDVVTGDTLTNVAHFNNLRLRIGTPAAWSTGDSVSLVITNVTGAYAGKLVLTNEDNGDNYVHNIETYAASSSTVYVSYYEETYDKNRPPQYLYINLLDGQHYQFDQVLAAAVCPCTVTLNRNNLDVDYTASYTVQNAGGGTTTVGGGGQAIPAFTRTTASGNLLIETRNQRYVDQKYTLEHGAVILTQSDGDVMYIPPAMAVNLVAGITDIELVLPGLQGTAGSLQGTATATLAISPGASASFEATMPNLVLTLPTQHGAAWTQYWSTKLQAAGLTYGSQFTVSSNTTSAQLTVWGVQSGAGSTVEDVVLTFRSSLLQVVPRAGA